MLFSSLRDMAGVGDDSGDSYSPSSNQNPVLRFLEFSLRLSVIPLAVASLWVMARNKEISDAYGKLEFTNLTVLKYLVCVNALSAGYSLAAIVFSCLRCLPSDWFYFVSDQVMAYLMVTSGSAVAQLMYIAYKGDREVSWSEACSYYGRFCSRAKVSMALHFIALVCFITLSVISGYRVFSKFEPPVVPSKEVGEQVE